MKENIKVIVSAPAATLLGAVAVKAYRSVGSVSEFAGDLDNSYPAASFNPKREIFDLIGVNLRAGGVVAALVFLVIAALLVAARGALSLLFCALSSILLFSSLLGFRESQNNTVPRFTGSRGGVSPIPKQVIPKTITTTRHTLFALVKLSFALNLIIHLFFFWLFFGNLLFPMHPKCPSLVWTSKMSLHLSESEATEMRLLISRLRELEVRSTTSGSTESPFTQTESVSKLIAKFEVKIPVIAPETEDPGKSPEVEGPTDVPSEPIPTTRVVHPRSSLTTKLPSIELPKFDGNDFEEFLKRWHRWLRLSGLQLEPDLSKCDWLIEACTPKVRRLVETVVDQHNSDLIPVLRQLSSLYPKLENDLTLRAKLDRITPLPPNPDPELVAQLALEIEEVFVRLSPSAMSDQDKLLILVKKIHAKTWSELRSDRYYKQRTSTFLDLKEALLEKSQEDWLERNLTQQKKQTLNPLDQPESLNPHQHPKPNSGKGKGKGLGKGKGKGGEKRDPVDSRFSATIQCSFCGKVGHYIDKCWKKQKEEKKGQRPNPGIKNIPKAPNPSNPQVPKSAQNSQISDPGNKKRKADAISVLSGNHKTYSFEAYVCGKKLVAFLDTGATVSAVSSTFVPSNLIKKSAAVPLIVGNGETVFSLGTATLNFNLGPRSFQHPVQVLETDAFEALLGTDFMESNQHFGGLLVRPARLVIDGEEVPLTDSTSVFSLHKVLRLKVSDESYALIPELRKQVIARFDLSPSQIRVDCFANKANRQEALYCTKENSLWRYNFSRLRTKDSEVLWSNPPFSKMAEFVTKLALEPCKMIVVHPDWNDKYWNPLLLEMCVSRYEIPSGQAIYLRDRSKKALKAPLWNTHISLIDSVALKIDPKRLDPDLVKWVRARSRNWGFDDLIREMQARADRDTIPTVEVEIPTQNFSKNPSKVPEIPPELTNPDIEMQTIALPTGRGATILEKVPEKKV